MLWMALSGKPESKSDGSIIMTFRFLNPVTGEVQTRAVTVTGWSATDAQNYAQDTINLLSARDVTPAFPPILTIMAS